MLHIFNYFIYSFPQEYSKKYALIFHQPFSSNFYWEDHIAQFTRARKLSDFVCTIPPLRFLHFRPAVFPCNLFKILMAFKIYRGDRVWSECVAEICEVECLGRCTLEWNQPSFFSSSLSYFPFFLWCWCTPILHLGL